MVDGFVLRCAVNEDAVIRELGPRAVAYARSTGWYLPGADLEDLEQEALFGLLRACRTYKPGSGPFAPFAMMCVRRWLIWTLRRDNSLGQRVLSHAARVARDEDGIETAIADLIPDPHGPAVVSAARERLRAILDAAPSLSELERRAVFGQAAGYSYSELSGGRQGDLDTRGKPRWRDLDNAMQRGRTKLRRAA